MISVAEICDFKGFSPGKLWFFLFFWFIVVGNMLAQDPASEVPSYNHLNGVQLADLSISIFPPSIDTSELPISIDTDSQGNVYVLTFGNGIIKRNSNGTGPQNFVTASQLNNAVDFVIGDDDKFYVADYSEDGSCSQNGKIKIFDSEGNFEGLIYTNFYRPLGVDVDYDGNIYVAEYNPNDPDERSCENSEMSRISIYNQAGNRIAQTANVNRPYRIAVNYQKDVFVSQEGGGDPAVKIFNQNLSILGELPNIQSPGSVVIDSFDYIYVNEYAGRLDFSRFVNFENLGFSEAQDIAEEIDKGIDDNAFGVRVYSPDNSFEYLYKEEIDFPVDIAFNSCDRMYINNGYVDGSSSPFGYIPNTIEFDLEIYERTPAFDITPPEITCQGDITVQAESGTNFSVVNYNSAIATDLCGVTVTRTSGLASGSQFPVGANSVEFTAIDSFGNTAVCTFNVIVEPADEQAPVATCKNLNIVLDSNGQAQIAAAQVYAGSEELDISLDRENFNCDDLGNNTVTLTVTDPDSGLSDSCQAIITVVDETAPVFENNCTDVNREVTITEGETYTIPDFSSEFAATDNCDENLDFSQEPVAGTEITETTDIAVRVSDDFGNRKSCLFSITVKTEEKVDTPPEFDNCPADISVSNDAGMCGAIVTFETPTVTDDNGSITPNRTDSSGLNSGDVFPVGETTISFQADDGVNDPVECSFTVTVSDNEKPVLQCPGNMEIMIAEGDTWSLQDFRGDAGASDNCGGDLEITQSPEPGTQISETTDVVLSVTDNSGNTESCSFAVTVIIVDEEDIVLNCPGEYEVLPNDNCEYIVPQFSEILDYGPEGTEISQSLAAGAVIEPNSDPYITIIATYQDKSEECSIYLLLINEIDISCPGNKMVSVEEGGSYVLPDYRDELNISDSCSRIEIIQTPGPNSVVTGDTEIFFEVSDDFGNTANCSFSLELVSENELFIECPANKEFAYDENCSFILPDFTSEAEVTNGDGLTVSQIPSPGTVVNNEMTEITLSVENQNGIKSCNFLITLQDNSAPELNLKEATINLGTGALASLSFQDIDNGSFDNCDPDVVYNFSKSSFSCKEIGENFIQVTATDSSGNQATGTTIVTVTDEQGVCEGTVVGSEFLFIYPNPNAGNFRIVTPPNIQIDNVEVFDHRGRFIAAKDFNDSDLEYTMNLGPLQEAVYVLKIVTNEKTVTKRFIFKY